MHVILCCTGLEEDEITGYSNGQCCFVLFCVGLEEDKITWFSNWLVAVNTGKIALGKSKIAWHSNFGFRYRQPLKGLEEVKIT